MEVKDPLNMIFTTRLDLLQSSKDSIAPQDKTCMFHKEDNRMMLLHRICLKVDRKIQIVNNLKFHNKTCLKDSNMRLNNNINIKGTIAIAIAIAT